MNRCSYTKLIRIPLLHSSALTFWEVEMIPKGMLWMEKSESGLVSMNDIVNERGDGGGCERKRGEDWSGEKRKERLWEVRKRLAANKCALAQVSPLQLYSWGNDEVKSVFVFAFLPYKGLTGRCLIHDKLHKLPRPTVCVRKYGRCSKSHAGKYNHRMPCLSQ